MMNQQETQTTFLSKNRIELRKFIIKWNHNYPIDFLWRKKYGVAFGSQEHRQMSFLDMLFDFEEEIMMGNMKDKFISNLPKENTNITGISDEEFENLDINQFNKMP